MTATDLETISREFINFGGIMDICPYFLYYSRMNITIYRFKKFLNTCSKTRESEDISDEHII